MSDEEGNDIVRRKAAELDRAARRTRCAALALNVVVAVLMVIAAGFSGWNTYRLRTINEGQQAQLEFNESLIETIQSYNQAHAEAAGQSFAAMAEALTCSISLFVNGTLPTREQVAACYRPVSPQPTPPTTPTSRENP